MIITIIIIGTGRSVTHHTFFIRLARAEGKTVKPTTVRKFTKVRKPESERSTRDIT